jgi:hypothetical protein
MQADWATHWSNNSSWQFTTYRTFLTTFSGNFGNFLFCTIGCYFLVSKHYNFQKLKSVVLRVWRPTFFYSASTFLFGLIIGLYGLSLPGVLQGFLPFISGNYWYVNDWIILILMSPILYSMFNALSRKQFAYLIILTISIALICAWPFGYNAKINNTRSLISGFILVYAVTFFYKKFGMPLRSRWLFLLGLMQPVGLLLSYALKAQNVKIEILTFSWDKVAQTEWDLTGIFFADLFSITTAVCFFICIDRLRGFRTRPIGKLGICVNIAASTCFSVYLIHMSRFLTPWLWQHIVQAQQFEDTLLGYFYPWMCIFAIFTTCAVIDLIRQVLVFRAKQIYAKYEALKR